MKTKTIYEIKVVEGNLEQFNLPTNIFGDYLSIEVSINSLDNFSPYFRNLKVQNTQSEINQKFWFSVGLIFGMLTKHFDYKNLKEINTTLIVTLESI